MSSDIDAAARTAGYELVGEPRRGGSGVVWSARAADGSTVALKLLSPGVDVERLRREAAVTRGLRHSNLVQLRELIDIGGVPALVTDWVEGVPLGTWIEDNAPVERDRAVRLLAEIADGLAALHDAGVVHRDLTAANVLVDGSDAPVIIDLGLARGTNDVTVTADGVLAGTPRYLAPEVINGTVGEPASDVYSLGVLASEVLTGEWPYTSSDAIAAALQQHLHAVPVPISERRPELVDLDDLVAWSLAKVPEARPTATAFGEVLRGRGAVPDELAAMLGGQASSIGLASVGAREKGRRWRFGLVVAAFGAVLSGLVLWQLGVARSDSDPSEVATTPASTSAAPTTSSSASAVAADGVDPLTTTDPARTRALVETTVVPETVPPDDGIDRLAVAGWEPGLAEQLACNLLTEADFETEFLPDNYWFDSSNPDREQVVAGVGRAGSSGLEVGDPEVFGLFGEIVDVEPGASYLFSLHAATEGEVVVAEMSVEWLDDGFDPFPPSPSLTILEYGDGQLTLGTPPAPAGAEYAVPRIYKDNSPGLLYVDELVFANEESDCRDLLLAER